MPDMTAAKQEQTDVGAAIAGAHRREWAAVLASTVRVTRDLDLAEECVQDAFARAVTAWPKSGIPANPGAWLTTVAVNRARDVLRRDSAFRRRLPLLVVDESVAGPEDAAEPSEIADDRLRLIFTCCHPALSREAQVALTLRLVCGLSTEDVARAFLVQETTMAARITRAKRKIAAARIPYRVPSAEELPNRVGIVCDVLHLVFTVGHTDPTGETLVRMELVNSAIWLTRMLYQLLPGEAEVGGLLGLMLLIDARRDTRQSASGDLVLLSEQDRSKWDAGQIAEGVEVLTKALRRFTPGRFQVEAAIAAVHAEAEDWEHTDWSEIVALYDALGRLWPSPVVSLNRAVAVGLRDGPQQGLDALGPLLGESTLTAYGYLSAVKADFLRQLEQWGPAREAYEDALALTENLVEQKYLRKRLEEVLAHLP